MIKDYFKILIFFVLIPGSTFPKAKPKQSLVTVLYLSLLRFFLLPLYSRWWVKETSAKVFILLLSLYILQMTNWAIYSLNVNKIDLRLLQSLNVESPVVVPLEDEEHVVPLCELLIPMGLSMLLCFIHSQIVATSSNTSRTSSGKRRQKFNPNRKSSQEKVRRKKKNLRSRPLNVSNDIKTTTLYDTDDESVALIVHGVASKSSMKVQLEPESVFMESVVATAGELSQIPNKILCNSTSSCLNSDSTSPTVRKRNVNWDSPIKSQFIIKNEPAPQTPSANPRNRLNSGIDDGFESLTGKSSSGEDNNRQNGGAVVPVEDTKKKGAFSKILESDSDTDTLKNSEKSTPTKICKSSFKAGSCVVKKLKESSDTDEENDDIETLTPTSSSQQFTEGTTSAGECLGVTSNSESDCSELDQSESRIDDEFDYSPATILNAGDSSERVSCTVWSKHEAKKAEMSVLDISLAIIKRVELIPETSDYIIIGLALSLILSLTPTYCRLCEVSIDSTSNSTGLPHILLEIPRVMMEETSSLSVVSFLHYAFGKTLWEKTILVNSFLQRLILAFLFFFLLAVAERTFKQRFLYAKLFSHLTSSRRAKKSNIPHFRLNKVRNIKAWLSVRSYLKRLGPQRSVDVIVSAAFITTLLLLSFLSLEFLKDAEHIHSQLNLEALIWSCALGTFLLRFMTLGTKINKKYRSISVLITEQINLYVQIEQKPQKKEELMVSNQVLKLASDLLKELDSPFKISGLSANSYLYNTVKVVILSALSGVLSEMLGFKLKLHKIKIK